MSVLLSLTDHPAHSVVIVPSWGACCVSKERTYIYPPSPSPPTHPILARVRAGLSTCIFTPSRMCPSSSSSHVAPRTSLPRPAVALFFFTCFFLIFACGRVSHAASSAHIPHHCHDQHPSPRASGAHLCTVPVLLPHFPTPLQRHALIASPPFFVFAAPFSLLLLHVSGELNVGLRVCLEIGMCACACACVSLSCCLSPFSSPCD